jgi:hypothetical protein
MGDTGDKGPVGDKGHTGLPGLDGHDGDDGIKGLKGTAGDRGDSGYKGMPGDAIKGYNGDKGLAGDAGLKGLAGDVGPKGPDGPTDIVRIHEDEADWQMWWDMWKAKLDEYEAFDGTCDDVMMAFEQTKVDAQALWEEKEQFFIDIESKFQECRKALKVESTRIFDEYTANAMMHMQMTQEMITVLKHEVEYYLGGGSP